MNEITEKQKDDFCEGLFLELHNIIPKLVKDFFKGQPDQPLFDGNWCLDTLMDKTKTIELIKKQDDDGVYHFMNLGGIVRMGYNNGRFSRYTPTEADLPEDMFLQTSGEAGWEISWTWDDVDYYIQGGKSKIISEALKIHIGQKLLQKVGV